MEDLPLKISARTYGSPFWIDVVPNHSGPMLLRLWQAKALRVQLDEAIQYVERQEQLDFIKEVNSRLK